MYFVNVYIFLIFKVATKNSVELLEDERNALVESIATKLGLRRVGWIFTDLVPLDVSTGSVKNYRGNIVSSLFFIDFNHLSRHFDELNEIYSMDEEA